MPDGGTGNKIGCGLAFASSTAIFVVFLAGNIRTHSAVDRFARNVAEKRVAGMVDRHLHGLCRRLHWAPGAPKRPPRIASLNKGALERRTYKGGAFPPGNIRRRRYPRGA
jgi:hypothetical protein